MRIKMKELEERIAALETGTTYTEQLIEPQIVATEAKITQFLRANNWDYFVRGTAVCSWILLVLWLALVLW